MSVMARNWESAAAPVRCYSHRDVAVIEVHSFGFTYPGAQRHAVRGVSFTVEPREIFGFLGPNGAGKSTTQNVLIRLLDGYEATSACSTAICAPGTETITDGSVSPSKLPITT
jgi:ABC-type glutathione transport system ATPase component